MATKSEKGHTHDDGWHGESVHDNSGVVVSDAVQLATDVTAIQCSPWTLSMFRLYGCLSIAYLCGCLNGYDGSLMGGLNAMSTYQEFFNMYVPSSFTRFLPHFFDLTSITGNPQVLPPASCLQCTI